MENKTILVPDDTGHERMHVGSGVSQGSVLKPALWNVFYDKVLGLNLPQGAHVSFVHERAFLHAVASSRLMYAAPV